MATKKIQHDEKSHVSTVQLAVGAASLFLFIVGLKRTFHVDPARAIQTPGTEEPTEADGYGGGSGRTR